MRARFGIGQGVVMVFEVIATGGCDSLELMIRKAAAEMAPGGSQSVIEHIVRIIHLIHFEDLLQAPLVESGIVSHQGQTLDLRSNLFPDMREDWSVFRVFLRESVDLLAKPLVILRLRMDQTVKRIHDLTIPDDDNPDAADTAAALIGRFKVYGSKVFHRP